MKMFFVFWLGACIAFADALFPYSALALAGWIAVAGGILFVRNRYGLD